MCLLAPVKQEIQVPSMNYEKYPFNRTGIEKARSRWGLPVRFCMQLCMALEVGSSIGQEPT